MIFKRYFLKKLCFFFPLFVLSWPVLNACDKQPSGEHGLSADSQMKPPRVDNPPEEDHPGSGPMAEISKYKERLNKNPGDLEALIFLGNSNFDIKRYEKAKELYIQALTIDPKNPSVRTDLASCFRSLGQPDQAIVELKTVLLLTPGHPPALFNLGVILLGDKGDKKGAVRIWQELLKKHPESPLSHGLAERIAQLQNEGGSSSQ